jgi:hypothetical protein
METFPMDDAATFQIRGIRPGAWIISSWKTRASEYLGRAAALPLDRVELLEASFGKSGFWGESGRKPVSSEIQPTRGANFPAAQKNVFGKLGNGFLPNPIHPDTREKPSTHPRTGTTPPSPPASPPSAPRKTTSSSPLIAPAPSPSRGVHPPPPPPPTAPLPHLPHLIPSLILFSC